MKTPSFPFMLASRLRGKNFLFEHYFKGKKTLDVGCGEGEFMKLSPETIWGVDPNTRAISKLKTEGFKAELSGAEGMPFKDGEFEMAHCHNVIEHLDIATALSMLRETARVLKPGGILVLSSEVVNRKFWNTFGHVKPYPPEAIIKLMRAESREGFEGLSGFEVDGLFYIGDYHRNKILYLLQFTLGHFTPWFRREYFLALKRV